jgi:hypothetical protein
LAVGHEHVNVKKIDLFINHQLTSIIDKIYLLEKIRLAETALQLSQGDRETIWLIRAEL